ncbi:MAG TPA: succinyl-diaminopimelate desuccinylase [Mycobacteriales bacterium]|nr:succinyl-diaminopimelate desuccinylase [Mycobacteriales bacterium]
MALDLRPLDLAADPVALTAALVDVPSESGDEKALADLVESALRRHAPHLELLRDGDAVLARTAHGHDRRVLIAGHLDTVPIADNVPSHIEGDRLYGCGSSDMKAALAVMLRLATDSVLAQRQDLTYVWYDAEEVEAARNGLLRLQRTNPGWLAADLAVLMEPTDGAVEAGCQGTMRATVTTTGRRAHSARSWLGENAVHKAGAVLEQLAAYAARRVVIDGCEYREGLQAVRIEGGIAGNVVPDSCTITVNFRFAPDRDEQQAADHLREVLAPHEVTVVDSAPGALPGLGTAVAQQFLAAVGRPPVAKLGWTDVSRFAAMGVPALNFGPGDPNLAHTRDESVLTTRIGEAEAVMRRFLAG